uniref:Putative transposable element n=1 Tax=Ixodes ricinus TaxID=34613 RepID=A0A090XE15_IXORI
MGRMSKETHLRVVRMYEAGHKLDFTLPPAGFQPRPHSKRSSRIHGCKNVSVKTRSNRKNARDRRIVAAVVDEPFTTPETLKKELNLPMKTANICKRLEEHGLVCLQNNFTRELTPTRKVRQGFVRPYGISPGPSRSGKVWCSPASRPSADTWDRHKSAWRTVHLWNDPVYVHQLKASGYTCINVLAVVTYDGLGPRRSVRRMHHAGTIRGHSRPDPHAVLPRRSVSRPRVSSCSTMPAWPRTRSPRGVEANGIHILRWPPNSEDLNPIQSIWSCMKERTCKLRHDGLSPRRNSGRSSRNTGTCWPRTRELSQSCTRPFRTGFETSLRSTEALSKSGALWTLSFLYYCLIS